MLALILTSSQTLSKKKSHCTGRFAAGSGPSGVVTLSWFWTNGPRHRGGGPGLQRTAAPPAAPSAQRPAPQAPSEPKPNSGQPNAACRPSRLHSPSRLTKRSLIPTTEPPSRILAPLVPRLRHHPHCRPSLSSTKHARHAIRPLVSRPVANFSGPYAASARPSPPDRNSRRPRNSYLWKIRALSLSLSSLDPSLWYSSRRSATLVLRQSHNSATRCDSTPPTASAPLTDRAPANAPAPAPTISDSAPSTEAISSLPASTTQPALRRRANLSAPSAPSREGRSGRR
jgi:hypothetical protein